MLFFVKSTYSEFKQCEKSSWLKEHSDEPYKKDSFTEAFEAEKSDIRGYVMKLFGDYVETVPPGGEKSPDPDETIERTAAYLAEGREVICGAAFSYDGFYCTVDVLKRTEGGYAVYDIKSDTIPDKYDNILDISYKKHILEKCGISVVGAYIITVNDNYVFDGTLDVTKLFNVTDVSAFVKKGARGIESDLDRAKKVLAASEPNTDLSRSCSNTKRCGYWHYCSRRLPNPSVFDLYQMPFKKAIGLYAKQTVSFTDVIKSGTRLNGNARRQIEYELEDKGTYVNKPGIRAFLKTLSFPLYFIDFEAARPAVPLYPGTRPYQTVPVQFSLHVIDAPGADVKHIEYLGRPECDPRREFAERLVAAIPEGACILAYNKTFEWTVVGELAAAFPDLADRLNSIKAGMKNLLDPFREGYYYNKAMGGSFSIMSVLPAIYPNDDSLDYNSLALVTGRDAMELFAKLASLPTKERKAAELDILKHCELDTFVLVKIYQELVRAAE